MNQTVAHFTGSYLPVTEGWIYDQIRFLRETRSIVLTKKILNLEHFPGPKIYDFSSLSPVPRLANESVRLLAGHYPYYRTACRREGVQLVHAHFGNRGRLALNLAVSLKVPIITSFYGRDMSQHERGLEGLREDYTALFAQGAAFIAEGPAARARLIEIGCPPDRIHIFRLGVDVAAIEFVPRHREQGAPLRLLMAGRFVEKKGLEYGLEAFCRLARDGENVELTIVGDAEHDPEEKEIKRRLLQLVTDHGVADRVRFTGFLPRAELDLLARTQHILVQPSVTATSGDTEGGHPVVLTQMAAAGMPIVATKHCDIPEIVEDGVTGWLCEERNVDEITAAIREAIKTPGRLAEMGANARKLVERNYDARQQTLDPIYAEVRRSSFSGSAGVAR